MGKKIGFVSLGCPKNQIDLEVMLCRLHKAGYEITGEVEEADIVIINTCAFLESAKQEAIDNILDIAWLKENRNLKGILVTGCLAQRYGKEVLEEMPEVDALIGVGSLENIEEAIKAVEKGEPYCSLRPSEEGLMGGDRILLSNDYTAYLKIAEGCDNRCTYCAIPQIRGKFRSRPMEDILKEAKDLDALGVKELCIVAQDTTNYGKDLYDAYKLPELLHRLSEETTGIRWIRILYCYPDKITDELVQEIKNNPKVLKYIDLPVQHISDRILKKMNRHGDSKTIRNAIEKLRREIPSIVLRTTAIVGFPGETEEEFEELCSFIQEIKFDRFGAFPYSREENTKAYDMEEQIDEQVKQDRYDMIMRLQYDIAQSALEGKIGEEIEVLCEDYDPVIELYYGRSVADAPEIDTKVYFSSSKKTLPGEFVKVKIEEALEYDLKGQTIS